MCDRKGCGNVITLGTFDFDQAKDEADDLKAENGWTTVRRGTNYADICPEH